MNTPLRPRATGRITLADVAQLAGVSPITVSRALRGERAVDPVLIAKVTPGIPVKIAGTSVVIEGQADKDNEFEQLKQREGISRAASKARDHFVVIQATYFFDVALHDGISQCGLAITTDNDLAVAAYTYNCCHERFLVADGKDPRRFAGH